MTNQRALLTEAEREVIAGERDASDNYEYSVRSRVRRRITQQLVADVETLAKHDPELLGELREVVCERNTND